MKQVLLKLDDELIKETKILAIRNDMSLKGYLEMIIRENLAKQKENERS